jgi:hypothetical protein
VKARYSRAYLDRLLSSDEYGDLAQVSSLLGATDRFSSSESDYGLPEPLFVFVEGLLWLAQSSRSGAWTYYEATPTTRQEAMFRALGPCADKMLARCYADGMHGWRDPDVMRAIDDWVRNHHDEIAAWLRGLVRANRSTIEELLS